MPLLFYFPLIIWMGMVEIMHDELRVPAKAKVGRRQGCSMPKFHYHAGARVISLMFT